METEQGTYLSAAEAVEYGEFKRNRRETEVALALKKLIVDASRRETDKHALRTACDVARKLHAYGVLVAPIHVAEAKRRLKGECIVIALVGGTGGSLPSVKKTEAKRAVRAGAGEIRLVPCYSALGSGDLTYLKKEVRRVRRAVRKGTLILSLEDHSLGEKEVSLGTRAAAAGKADGVCVRGETELLSCALQTGMEKLRTDVSGIENAEQLRLLMKAGAVHAATEQAEKVAEEMYRAAEEGAALLPAEPPVQNA